jgi:hypothetical protein
MEMIAFQADLRSLRPAGCVLLLTTLLVACGGVSENPPIGNGHDGGGSGSGGSGGGSGSSSSGSGGSGSGSGSSSSGGQGTGCPLSPPVSGASCTEQSLSCEYGEDQDLRCDTLATCDGSWNTTVPSGASCPTSPPGSNGCPTSYADVHVGQSCTGNSDCAYPQGRCACTLPLGGPVHLADAGSTWTCEAPGGGCPEPRPHAGTACSAGGPQQCDYGTCTLPGGAEMVCTNGAWTVDYGGCAELVGAP